MDEKLARKINRQLRGIKIMLGFFFLMSLAMLLILGFIAFKVISFTRTVDSKINNIEQSTSQKLDVKSQLCSANNSTKLLEQFCN